MDIQSDTRRVRQGRKQDFSHLGPPILLAINEASYISGLSRSKLYRLMAAGVLDYRKIGKRRLILWASLEAFLEDAGKSEACPEAIR